MRIKLITAIGAVVLVTTLSSAALAHTLHRHTAPARHPHPVVTFAETPGNPAPENSKAGASEDAQDQAADTQDDNNQGDDDSQGDTKPPASEHPTGTSSSDQGDDNSQGDQNDQSDQGTSSGDQGDDNSQGDQNDQGGGGTSQDDQGSSGADQGGGSGDNQQ